MDVVNCTQTGKLAFAIPKRSIVFMVEVLAKLIPIRDVAVDLAL